MSLIARLLPDPESRTQVAAKVPLLQFGAYLREYARGDARRADIVSGLVLLPANLAELDTILARIDASATPLDAAQDVVDGCLLGEGGRRYTTQTDLRTRLSV